MEYSKLTTGKECSLSELFSKDNKVIIPDMQRDYCWGTKQEDKELVSDFTRNIINNGFQKGTGLSLGLIYGYETPVGHIQLCDGQQRITTLFLLLGLLNKESKNAFQHRLISGFEYNQDDKEPYLQYSIRESSLYFLSDLVCHFFTVEDKLTVGDIPAQNWYFSDYDLDPSIQSMIRAMTILEQEIKNIDPLLFVTYLVEKLTFIYYDMGDRFHGEETFVIINTTGEPLSATENMKPLFISAQRAEDQKVTSETWEKWETWFWRRRKGLGAKENDTAENGFREFFRWITLLKTTNRDHFKQIQETGDYRLETRTEVNEIEAYFEIVRFLFEDPGLFSKELDLLAPDHGDKNINTQIVWFRLLPVIEYVKRFGKDNPRNIIRAKIFYDHLSRIDNVAKGVGAILFDAIQVIKNMDSADLAETRGMPGISSQILSEEEKEKFSIYLNAGSDRVMVEDYLWKAEEHCIWSGEILPLIKWSYVNEKFNISRFKEFYRVFCALFHDDLKYDELDLTRRALLTLGLKEYPRIFRGYTNTSFCRENNDWKLLIKDNVVEFGKFLEKLIPLSPIEPELQKMIDAFPRGNKFDDFIHIPEVLKFCSQKNVQYSSTTGWVLLKQEKMSAPHANLKTYLLYLDLVKSSFWDSKRWIVGFYDRENSCVIFDEVGTNLRIDIFYSGPKEFCLQVFFRDSEHENSRLRLASLANLMKFVWDGERYKSNIIDYPGIIKLLTDILVFPVQ